MDEAVMLRAVERILAVLIGGFAIYLGYLLFVRIPEQREGEGKILFPWGLSIFVARVGPGVFFALFGAAVVGVSLYKGIVASLPGDAEQTSLQGSRPQVIYSGISEVKREGPPVELVKARNRLRLQVEFLNGLPSRLKTDLSDTERREVAARSLEIKLMLMERVWGQDWGDLGRLRLWAESGAEDPAPEPSDVVKYFRAGQEAGK
jgi:hypothetical protein